jgi:hypothetical protein
VTRIRHALEHDGEQDQDVMDSDMDGFATFLASWQFNVVQSGVTQRPGLETCAQQLDHVSRAFEGVAAAAAAAPGLRSCALASCGAREAHPSHFKSCAAYRTPAYVLLQGAPGGGLAEPQGGLQSGAPGGRREAAGRWRRRQRAALTLE